MRIFILIAAITVALAARAHATPDEMAGRVVADIDGGQFDLPLLQSRYTVGIEGDMATVEVVQTFENPTAAPLNAEYLFPLNQHAAVFGMQMRVGDEVIEAVIREKAEAKAEFDQAKEDGKAAALLTQHRPNMFTQDIANLMPGMPIEVRLRYVQMVPKVNGVYQLVIPMVVGPRYLGADSEATLVSTDDDLAPAAPNRWSIAPVPDYPLVGGLDLPDTVTGERVALDVQMTSGVPLAAFGSRTHPLTIQRGDGRVSAGFADGKVMDNRDLVLHYSFAAEDVAAAVLSHEDARGGFLSLMIEPPELPDASQIVARELVFVLDTSGSMSGQPMQASKRFMQAALDGLRAGDHFRIIPFSNTARQMSNAALPATPRNIRSAKAFVQGLSGGGGTEIDNAIRTAFATRQPQNTMRIVVFLSDGYIGAEHVVLKTIRDQVGDARIYAFGVGSAVNRYLLDGMAEEGRGYARYVGLDEEALEVAETLARDLKSPLLTDIEIDWGESDIENMSPARVPDLFAGNAVRIHARHATGDAPESVTIKGRVGGRIGGRTASIVVPLTQVATQTNPALPLIWARNRIAELERNVAVGLRAEASDAEITRLGLAFSLQSKNTSFVAVSQRIVNESGEEADTRSVAVPMVHGVTSAAYPGFSGSSTPEPQTWLGMLVLAALSLLRLRKAGARRLRFPSFSKGAP